MKIAIAGTRGIPNNYGGFEQCAEFLSVLLQEKGHEVVVYNSHDHPYSQPDFKGVKIVKIFNPEHKIGTAGNFIYDYLSMRHALKNNYDILLVLGYTTASLFFPFLNKRKTILVTNMDGLEWKRDKWNSAVKKLALWFEKLGARYSDYLVADNAEIKSYLESTYHKKATLIAYGCAPFNDPVESHLAQWNVTKGNYSILIARMEAENNIAMVVEGYATSSAKEPLLVVGKVVTEYGRKLKEKFSGDPRIRFTGGIYDLEQLNNLRYYSRFYFHGHSVGGTNPSLLEAMASQAFIIAHGNKFNMAVLGSDALYFQSAKDIAKIIGQDEISDSTRRQFVENNYRKVVELYNWERITGQYEQLFNDVLKAR